LFKEYLNNYRECITEGNPNNGICYDGAVMPEVYFQRKPRLLFLLKETNGNNNDGSSNDLLSDWDYMCWVNKQAKRQEPLYRSVYRNIAMWSRQFELYSLGNVPKASDLMDENGLVIDDTLCRALEGIALINLKKSWGTESTDWYQMKSYLDGDTARKDILRHQVTALAPDLVLCGGTFDFAHDIFGKESPIGHTIANHQRIDWFISNDTMFVSCYHPSKPGWSREASFTHANNLFEMYFKMKDSLHA